MEIDGNDTAGTVVVTFGNDVAIGEALAITFAEAFAEVPSVTLTPVNNNASTIDYYVERDETGWKLMTTGNVLGETTVKFDYQVIQ